MNDPTGTGRGAHRAWRVALTCWIVACSLFATNVVREHYPALTLADHGTLRVDEYAGLHSDLFQHTDGHWYINNQVACSAIAAGPLFVFRPVLTALRDRRLAEAAAGASPRGDYATEYPMQVAFFRKVRERGLDLKFGAATAVTSVFVMAPIAALLGLLVHVVLRRRGAPPGRAAGLAIVAVLGTPILYRAAHLNHNLMLAAACFGSFVLLWSPGGSEVRTPTPRLVAAGFLAGLCVALDYSGVVPFAALALYAVHRAWGAPERRHVVRSFAAFSIGAVPAGLFLLGTQWSMFGDPFRPAQMWMPDQNEFALRGARGFGTPDARLFLANLVDLDWGLYAFAPILALGLVPAPRVPDSELVLPRRERRFVAAFIGTFLLFCACNQYGWLQWNTGFRYLIPVVPFAFLQAADRLVRLRPALLALIAGVSVAHTLVLCMVRYTPPLRGDVQAVPECWSRVLAQGVQVPWLRVLRNAPSIRVPLLHEPWLPYGVLATLGLVLWLVWRGAGADLRTYRNTAPMTDR